MTFGQFVTDAIRTPKAGWEVELTTLWGSQIEKATGIPGPFLFSEYRKREGYSGGDCWGGTASYEAGEDLPPFKALDTFLQDICPDLSMRKYLAIKDKVREYEWGEDAYYGNEYNYSVEYIPLRVIYDIIYGE